MNCYLCNHELIVGGDHDIEEENESFSMVTNLSCPECDAFVEVYTPKEEMPEWAQKVLNKNDS